MYINNKVRRIYYSVVVVTYFVFVFREVNDWKICHWWRKEEEIDIILFARSRVVTGRVARILNATHRTQVIYDTVSKLTKKLKTTDSMVDASSNGRTTTAIDEDTCTHWYLEVQQKHPDFSAQVGIRQSSAVHFTG